MPHNIDIQRSIEDLTNNSAEYRNRRLGQFSLLTIEGNYGDKAQDTRAFDDWFPVGIQVQDWLMRINDCFADRYPIDEVARLSEEIEGSIWEDATYNG